MLFLAYQTIIYFALIAFSLRKVFFKTPIIPYSPFISRIAGLEIEKRYELKFLEIGTDEDHVHFLVQSVPRYSVTKMVTMIKSITARKIFANCPKVKSILWGGEFWTDGYFASTVGKHGDEKQIANYVKNQGKEYKNLYHDHQLRLF